MAQALPRCVAILDHTATAAGPAVARAVQPSPRTRVNDPPATKLRRRVRQCTTVNTGVSVPSSKQRRRLEVPTHLYQQLQRIAARESRTVAIVAGGAGLPAPPP